jgi:hypothetical protein
MKRNLMVILVALLALGSLSYAQDRGEPSARSVERITREVRHELLMLPYFSVFDNIRGCEPYAEIRLGARGEAHRGRGESR